MNKYSNLKKVLVFGVGVIGAYLVHSLSEAGNDDYARKPKDRDFLALFYTLSLLKSGCYFNVVRRKNFFENISLSTLTFVKDVIL